MRVLLVSHGFPPEGIAGVERYTEGLAGALSAGGDVVSIAARAKANEDGLWLERELLGNQASLYRLRCPRIPPERFLLHSRVLEGLFETVLAETAPEVVHFNHLIRLSPRLVDIAARRGAATVISLHDYYFACARHQLVQTSGQVCAGPDGGRECARTCFAGEGEAAAPRWRARTAYFRLVLRLADRVLCPSRFVASYFEPLLSEPERLRVLPLGLPASQPRRGTRGTGRSLRLAVLGLVFENKGAHLVLEALAQSGLSAAHLAVHGQIIDPEYASALEDRARTIPGLEFVLGGEYELAELPRLLEGVDCLVVPSLWPEAFSLVAREALALGVPVLAARIGALPEAIVEGENGLTFAPGDAAELAGLLRRLDEDASVRERLRAGARRRPQLTMAAHSEAVRALYGEAVEEVARRGSLTPEERRELARLEQELVRLAFDGDGR